MADDDKKSTIIIVKKMAAHAGAHGGAWKVAYADFVTAMMAFFLLMWLLNSVAVEKREALVEYFQKFNVFTVGGTTFIKKDPVFAPVRGAATKAIPHILKGLEHLSPGDFGEIPHLPWAIAGKSTMKPTEFAEKLAKQVETQLGELKDQVKIEVREDGVRIQLIDKEGRPMFKSGAIEPTALGRQAIAFMAKALADMPNAIAIDGHTDAQGYNEGSAGNWSLSTKRALAARDLLEEEGVSASQFARVTGFADTDPYVPGDSTDTRNRRVSLTIMFPKASEEGFAPE